MAILLFADGTIFHGKAFGFEGTTSGEICFNTGMTGYQEIFTDPSYYGQMLVMNNVHVGNYGVCDADKESPQVSIRCLIGRNLEHSFSRHIATQSLNDYLIEHKIVAIGGVDTRALVAYIRDKGSVNVVVSHTENNIDILQKILQQQESMEGQNLANFVSTKKILHLGNPDARKKIAVIDYGIKQNILKCLLALDFKLVVFPHNSTYEKILASNADAYFLSNGPGDPAAMTNEVAVIKKLLTLNKPMFGICLGHQLVALANGLSTYKLKYGHRGINHPVKNIIKNSVEITTQNHGFGVNTESIKNNANVCITHINLNDQSIEGIMLKDKPVFSVQYHPESTPGPYDSRYLFDDFARLINNVL